MSDLKNSILVNQQVPEYVREEYPLFVNFLEAYYEYLETKQGTQKNDLVTQAKNLRYVSDVDDSIDNFEESFLNNFAALMPQTSDVDKAFLIKNVLPVYLSKGSEKSFSLLFRLLYGSEVDITFPKDNILRASAGEWTVENVLRINNDVFTKYTGNGSTTTFFLAQQTLASEITVYVNNVLTTSGFNVRKETKKLIFNTAPTNGSVIKVYYTNFDFNLFTSRKITGTTSGATTIIERAAPRLITQQTSIELYTSTNNLTGTFLNAEEITSEIIGDDGTTLITLVSNTISTVNSIVVTNSGSRYNIGDPVAINAGGFITKAEAVIDSVTTGFVDVLSVQFGGAGFQIGGLITASGLGGTRVVGAATAIDSSGDNSANSYSIFTDVISPYANVSISSSNYGFPSNVIPTGENVSTRLIDAFSIGTVTGIGPISNITVLFSDSSNGSLSYDSQGAQVETLSNTFIDIKTFGSLGRIRINNGGNGYVIGDEIVFGSNPPGTFGAGAAAAVTNVNSNGAITKVEFGPSTINGTVSVSANSIQVIGTATDFGGQLSIGDRILINLESRYINSISSSTTFNVNVAFTKTSTNKRVGVYNRSPIGGSGYIQNNFPSLTVTSSNGSASGANVEVISVMGDSERIAGTASTVAGQIRSIKITNSGAGYEFLPAIDLTGYGDGTATAEAAIERSYVSFPGRWKSSEGILSALDRKVQGLDYYIDFTYLTAVQVEFSKYKDILKGLLHPAGFKNYAEYPINKNISLATTLSSAKSVEVSGTVNVNSSIYVTGTNTRFITANTRGILTIGSNVAVNNQTRTVNAIISNTQFTVSSAFTMSSNTQSLIIVT
jgi:hypothetical protein